MRFERYGLASKGREAVERVHKGVGLLKRPRFAHAMLVHGVGAATEHLSAIRICQPEELLDAGANKGQFSLALRAARPSARIVAFEPLPEAADVFERMFREDDLTCLQRVALGDTEGSAEFTLADRTDSSSLLKLGKGQERAFGCPGCATIKFSVKRLQDSARLCSASLSYFTQSRCPGRRAWRF